MITTTVTSTLVLAILIISAQSGQLWAIHGPRHFQRSRSFANYGTHGFDILSIFFLFSIECICDLVRYICLIYEVLYIYLAVFFVISLLDHVACYWIFRVHIWANVVLVKTCYSWQSTQKYISKFIRNKTLKNYQPPVCHLPCIIKNGQKNSFWDTAIFMFT